MPSFANLARYGKGRKEFYEVEACKRCAGRMLAQAHKASLSLMQIVPQDIFLDVGCGGGAVLHEVAGKGATSVGLDISITQIKYAKTSRLQLFLVVADAESLPFRDNVFTKALAIEVLEHVPNPIRTVTEMYRVLRDCGEAIIVVPNDKNWFIHRILEGRVCEAFHKFGHLHDLSSIEKLRPILQNFEILRMEESRVRSTPLTHVFHLFCQKLLKIHADQTQRKARLKLARYRSDLRNLKRISRFFAASLALHSIIKLRKQ